MNTLADAAPALPPEWLARLADIEPPPPAGLAWLWTLIAVLLLSGLLGGVWLLRSRRRAGAPADHSPAHPLQSETPEDLQNEALRRLDRLEHRWRQGHCSSREAAYHLAAILRRGAAIPSERSEAWAYLQRRLDELRYPRRPAGELEPELFARARAFLEPRVEDAARSRREREAEQPPA